jgi:predicted AlkP superfamily phosphohydrolase/phosphomutase
MLYRIRAGTGGWFLVGLVPQSRSPQFCSPPASLFAVSVTELLIMSLKSRLLIIGLDCAEPSIVFSHLDKLPNLASLCAAGRYGPLRSVIPPITCPAWMCMFTGKDPGTLGVYGFRNRSRYDYTSLDFATSRSFKHPKLWDWVGEAGGRSIVLGVPPTYPPRPLAGEMVSCFMTPGREAMYTFPAALRAEVEAVSPAYQFDAADFRTNDKDRLLRDIRSMTTARFELARHLMKNHDWDLFAMVEIGLDRVQHGFWRFHDPNHRDHTASPLNTAIMDYYRLLDAEIGSLLEIAGPETPVLVVSDHGAKRMDGGVCINEWLMQRGLLTLESRPDTVTPFSKVKVDWSKTRVWSEGGYYARIFLNVVDREPTGIVSKADYERVRDDLVAELGEMAGPNGARLGNQVYRPEELYAEVNGIAPDLIVLFGDLHWRSLGSVGQPDIFAHENDTGPDDANHAQDGIWALNRPTSNTGSASVSGHQQRDILDIAPMARELLGLSG